MDALTVENLHITRGKLVATVRVRPGARRTSARLAVRVTADHPSLPQHSCVNSAGPVFDSVMANTSTPHLLEHLIIGYQVAEEPANSTATFAGHTAWLDEAAGLATVTVNFRSDACALRAMAYACSYLNAVLKEDPRG